MPPLPRTRIHCARLLMSCALVLLPLSARAQDGPDAGAGQQVFTTDAAPPCALCHTLSAAEASGTIGPNLDDLKPTEEQVRAAVSGGIGVMPAYGDTLSEEQIDAVARYVAGAVAD